MDERGIVIFMVDEKMSPAVGKQLLKVKTAKVKVFSVTTQSQICSQLVSFLFLRSCFEHFLPFKSFCELLIFHFML